MPKSARDRNDADCCGRHIVMAWVPEDRIWISGCIISLVMAMEHTDDVPLDGFGT